ncbi:DUF2267 domain-containing protein [Methylobrevis pamukkalensis]|nr:DUF2267 domain-containing protein [Methylobrevis pamukkalensis]
MFEGHMDAHHAILPIGEARCASVSCAVCANPSAGTRLELARIRGIHFEGWQPSASPARDRRKEEFVDRIRHDMSSDPTGDPDRAVAAVVSLLDRRLDHGEISQVRNSMTTAPPNLWPVH